MSAYAECVTCRQPLLCGSCTNQMCPGYVEMPDEDLTLDEVTPHMVDYARAFLDDALKAMTQSIHGTPTTSMYIEDCIRKARAALTPEARNDRP